MFRRISLFAASLFLCLPAMSGHAQYALFSRSTDTISVAGHTTLGNAATYEARVLLLSISGNGIVFNEWQGGQDDKLFGATQRGVGAYSYPVNYKFPDNDFHTSYDVSDGAFHHIAYVYDGTQERLYLDGALIASRAASGGVGTGNGTITTNVGAIFRDGFIVGSFRGYIDTLRISNVARYSGASFVAPTQDLTSDGNTQLLYNFNEAAGSATITDLSGNGHTGTLGTGFTGATSPILGAFPYGPLSGTLQFKQLVTTAAAQTVALQFRDPATGSDLFDQTASVPAAGTLNVPSMPLQPYTLWIKPGAFLARKVAVTTSDGAFVPFAQTFDGGDANNDNKVDTTDFGILVGAYGSDASTPESGYDIRADFNGDGTVDTTDFGILVGDYGRQGDL